jgi:transposase
MSDCTAKAARMTVGLDLGDRYTYVYVLGEDGEMVDDGRVRTTPEALKRRFGGMQPARVALETGTHSPWVSRLLEGCGHEVIVANPRQVGLIFGSGKKTDPVNAEQLARLARVDKKLLAPVQHRTRQGQAHLSVLRNRDVLVRARSQLVTHVRGIAKSFGSRLPQCSAESFHKKCVEDLPEEVTASLLHVMQVIGTLTETIRHYDKVIEKACEEGYAETQRMSQVAGVGALTALAFLLTIGDPRRFPRSRTVGAYFGLVPRRDDSGERSPQLRITKQGDGFVRRLLVGSAHYILGPFGPDTDLRRWGLKLCERGGKNAKKRAIVAVARRLAVLLLALWKNEQKYEPLRNGS